MALDSLLSLVCMYLMGTPGGKEIKVFYVTYFCIPSTLISVLGIMHNRQISVKSFRKEHECTCHLPLV